ncbi:proteasome subunit alpha type-8-like [Choristoneura fumiferana]|uniref:proteasome subunit alpha type-8-like n=1 Tax=Choristoneura fumiferana TaxID=7141 RepID=UPI003D159704
MSGYDRAITVFSPDGQLLQVQYAQEAVRKGSAVIGIRGSNVIVLAVEKKSVAKLQEERTEKKIVPLDEHVVLAFAGLRADARVLITRSQIECQSHRLTVEDPATIEYVTRYIASMKQQYTQSNGRRPFGISCLIGGFDYDGTPHLFQTEPSGIYYEWKASSAGRYDKTTREFLEKNYTPEAVATDKGTIKLAIRTLLEIVQSGQRNIEVAVLKMAQPVRMLEQDAINAVAREIEQEKADAEKNKK